MSVLYEVRVLHFNLHRNYLRPIPNIGLVFPTSADDWSE